MLGELPPEAVITSLKDSSSVALTWVQDNEDEKVTESVLQQSSLNGLKSRSTDDSNTAMSR